MTVGKKKKKNAQSVDDFISQGGSVALESNGDSEPCEEVRMTFRCPGQLIKKLDSVRKKRPGNISRNQAIIEALSDYLDKCST